MNIDPESPVVKACAQGIEMEMKGNIKAASELYLAAWEMKENDFDACIVAHYIARIQNTPRDILYWNQEALRHADKVGGENMEPFYPSLLLNIGKAYEDMDSNIEAGKYYQMALDKAGVLPGNELGKLTLDAIHRGIQRVNESTPGLP